MEEKFGLLLTAITTVFIISLIVLFGGLEPIGTISDKTERIISSLSIEPGLVIFLVFIAVMLLVFIVSYVFVRFEHMGIPSKRVLSKISDEVGEEPFQLKKVDGKWIAQTKEKQDI